MPTDDVAADIEFLTELDQLCTAAGVPTTFTDRLNRHLPPAPLAADAAFSSLAYLARHVAAGPPELGANCGLPADRCIEPCLPVPVTLARYGIGYVHPAYEWAGNRHAGPGPQPPRMGITEEELAHIARQLIAILATHLPDTTERRTGSLAATFGLIEPASDDASRPTTSRDPSTPSAIRWAADQLVTLLAHGATIEEAAKLATIRTDAYYARQHIRHHNAAAAVDRLLEQHAAATANYTWALYDRRRQLRTDHSLAAVLHASGHRWLPSGHLLIYTPTAVAEILALDHTVDDNTLVDQVTTNPTAAATAAQLLDDHPAGQHPLSFDQLLTTAVHITT